MAIQPSKAAKGEVAASTPGLTHTMEKHRMSYVETIVAVALLASAFMVLFAIVVHT